MTATAGVRPGRIPIAFVHRGLDWIRGSEQCLLDLLGGLDRERFHPLVVCTSPTLAQETERLGVEAALVDWWEQMVLAPAPIRARMRALLTAHRTAIVHANMTATVPSLLPMVRSLHVPIVAHLHMPQNDTFWRIREMVHQTDMAVGVAEHVVRELREDGMPDDRIRVIHNAVDTTRLAAGDASGLRAELGIAPQAFVAVSIGSLIHRKGHDVSLRALALVRERGLDAHLLLCGDGVEGDALKALASSLGLDGAAHFLGYRSDVGAVARDAGDICLTSSREEALSLNVLEAQWMGVPVVASAIPGHLEGIQPGVSAVVVPVEDPPALADALVELASSPERRRALSAAGREFVADRFSIRRYVGEFEALYEELLARPRSQFGWWTGTRWVPEYARWAGRVVRRRLARRP